jgi:8-oxo-dGTP pyrophosphatase MutT (NUDIX family)
VNAYLVQRRQERFQGAIFSVVSDDVAMPDGGTAQRDYMRHCGAAAVAALDEAGRIVLVNQYRHPVGRFLLGLPAGLVDVPDESHLVTAQRELAEEADLVAGRWNLLAELHTSPGYSDEFIRIYLARDLAPVPEHARHQREHEEAEMTTHVVDLDEAVAMAFRGEITDAAAVVGLLAAARARDADWAPLRPATA